MNHDLAFSHLFRLEDEKHNELTLFFEALAVAWTSMHLTILRKIRRNSAPECSLRIGPFELAALPSLPIHRHDDLKRAQFRPTAALTAESLTLDGTSHTAAHQLRHKRTNGAEFLRPVRISRSDNAAAFMWSDPVDFRLLAQPFRNNVLRNQIGPRLPFDDNIRLSVADEHHRGPRDAIIVAGHGVVVRARAGYRQNVAGLRFRQPDVDDEFVAAFASLAGHGDGFLGGIVRPVGEHRFVFRPVQRKSRVVGHAAVDGNILANARDVLVRAHRIQGGAGFSRDAASRFDPNFRRRVSDRAELRAHRLRDRFHVSGRAERRVFLRVADAESAADVDNPELESERFSHFAGKLGQLSDRRRESFRLENLRADVGVQAEQLNVLRADGVLHRPHGRAGADVKTELGIGLSRRNEFVRVRLHAGRYPKQRLHAHRLFRGDMFQ